MSRSEAISSAPPWSAVSASPKTMVGEEKFDTGHNEIAKVLQTNRLST